jgi:hypothetical protein
MDVTNRRKVMKKTLKSIMLLGALCGGALHASFDFLSPLSFDDRGYIHWFLAPADQAWWYDTMPSAKKHTDWNIHMWGAAYTRSANRAFFDKCDPCDSDKVTRKTTSLSQLFFGQTVFRGENAFPGGTFLGNPAAQLQASNVNPFLAFARIMPNFEYSEKGANMGIDFARYVGRDDRYHIGARFNIPFKIIEIEQDGTIVEGLDDVFVTRIVTLDAGVDPDYIEYAMRYDFLSSLVFSENSTPSGILKAQPVVTYFNNPNAQIGLVGTQLTGVTAADNNLIPSAYATKNNCGDLPAVPFTKLPTQVGGSLGSDGQGVNGATLFFETNVDYANNLALDRNAQGTVFVTPRGLIDAQNNLTISPISASILSQVDALITTDLLVAEPVTTFFLNNGINLLGSDRIVGLGDFATEVYGGVGHYNDWFVDGIFGIRFPTGKKQKHSNDVYYKPTGNNGHFEIKLEIDGGWQPRPWFAFEIRPAYSHVCKRSEKRAAPFAGATVVNIGPEIEADVSWNYFVLQTDFSFFHPHNRDLGFTLGYELFVKGHDHVSICQTAATDFFGNTGQPLAACNYEVHTNSLSNKLRGEIFHRWNYFELFGGGSQILSGRNIMKETEGHIGLAIYF